MKRLAPGLIIALLLTAPCALHAADDPLLNAKSQSETDGRLTAEKLALKRIEREWRYLHQRAQAAQQRLGTSVQITEVLTSAEAVQDRCAAGDTTILPEADALRKKLGTRSAQVNHAIASDVDLVVSFAQPYSQLAPSDIAPMPTVTNAQLLALRGEYGAVGIVVANGTDRVQDTLLTVEGLSSTQFICQVRRQVFLETWYKRTTTRDRVADPLCLLPSDENGWKLTLDAGEIAKLYISVHCLEQSADADAKLCVKADSGQGGTLSLEVRVVGPRLPESVRFGHTAFIYPSQDRSREATATDLGTHGVNRMEFTHLPPCTFTPEGALVKASFAQHEAWLRAYTPHVEKMMIFWAAGFRAGFPCIDGTKLGLRSAPGRRALVSLLRAFFDRMAQLGYRLDRFAILPFDEVHSKSLENSPDENVVRAVEVMKLLKQEFPELEILMTLTFYAFSNDVKAIAPYIDVALPHIRWPTKLTRNAPPTYNPREAFAKQVWPALEAEREKRGMKIWSYRVAPGKSDNVLANNRAYPILAVGAGMTGVGTWAYNVSYGSTWDDTDGKPKPFVDYLFVYNGREKHPLNKQFNPVGEVVVPSIRWEALRAGIQDARVLLHLRNMAAQDTCPAALRAGIQNLLDRVEGLATDDSVITWEAVEEVAQRGRQIYARNK